MEKLLIALHSNLFAQILAKTFQNEFEVRTCCDGCEALALLNSFRPQAMILSLCLPRKDSLTILSQSSHIPQVILGVADYRDPYCFSAAQRLGMEHILVTPTVDSVSSTLLQMLIRHRQSESNNPQLQASQLLHSMGFNANINGYQMLCIGIALLAKDPCRQFSHDLYAAIADQVGGTQTAAEAAIRRSIRNAWANHDPAVWAKYFPPNAAGKIPCPNNSLFMKTLARYIRL